MFGKRRILASLYTTRYGKGNPHYGLTNSNKERQFDLLYLRHNIFKGNTYKYILTYVNVVSRNKVARALRTNKASQVAFVLEAIYSKGSCLNIKSYSNVIMVINPKLI